jgi:hypothetical protein
MKIYIVLHHEIFSENHIDEMVFYLTSSVEKAVELIKDSAVDTWSWWEIQSSELDDSEWPEHVGWYDRKGRKVRNVPFAKAMKSYKKLHKNESS